MHIVRIPAGLILLVLVLCLPTAWAQTDVTILYTANSRGHYRPIRA